MSVLISLHASEYGNLLRKLKANRKILICDADIGLRVGWFFQGLGINGEEKRPFSDQEVESLVEHYKYFNAFFGKQGLLPIKKIKSMHTKLKENKIPEELSKCKKCGEYKGVVTEEGEDIAVFCLCNGILCPKCKENKIHRPISNSYDEKDNDIIHYPYFTWMVGCAECRKNRKETDGQALPILYPKEIQKLLRMRKIFEQKSELEKAQHKHSWSPAIIPPSSATRNNRKTEVCFECGKIGKQFEDAPPLTKMRWVKSFARWLMGKNESL